MNLKQLFCWHNWEITKWTVHDKEGKKLYKDVGLFNKCEKCGKINLIFPKFSMGNK